MPNSFVTPWTIAHQAPLVCRISQARILEWVLPFPSPGDLPTSPALTGGFFTIGATREAQKPAKSQLIWQSRPLPPQHSGKQDPRVTLCRQRAPHLRPRSDHTPGLQTRVPSLADFEPSSAHLKSDWFRLRAKLAMRAQTWQPLHQTPHPALHGVLAVSRDIAHDSHPDPPTPSTLSQSQLLPLTLVLVSVLF